MLSVWRIRTVPGSEKLRGRHQTQKPLRLVRRSLLAYTCEGDLVFDPFCGPLTMAVAAKELNRFLLGRRWVVELFAVGAQGRSRTPDGRLYAPLDD